MKHTSKIKPKRKRVIIVESEDESTSEAEQLTSKKVRINDKSPSVTPPSHHTSPSWSPLCSPPSLPMKLNPPNTKSSQLPSSPPANTSTPKNQGRPRRLPTALVVETFF